DALEQRRLARSVRADDRDQRAGLDRAVEVVHRRMAVIAEREVAKLQRGGHRLTSSSPRRRRSTAPRSARRRWPTAAPPTCAGSTAKSTPEGVLAPGDGGGAGGARASACSLAQIDLRRCYNVTLALVQPVARAHAKTTWGADRLDFAHAPSGLRSLAPRSRPRTCNMSEQRPRVVAVGEALIEFIRGGDGRFGIGCAGDTFNVAVYLPPAGLRPAFSAPPRACP